MDGATPVREKIGTVEMTEAADSTSMAAGGGGGGMQRRSDSGGGLNCDQVTECLRGSSDWA